jgi:photosystem II stability/assembly factor-like uncharacterized protein
MRTNNRAAEGKIMKAQLVFALASFMSLAQYALAQNQSAIATKTRTPIPLTEYSAVIADPADSLTIYVGSKQNGVFRTTDGGASWQQVMRDAPVHDLLVINEAVFAARPDGVFKSIDKGENWKKALNISARSFLVLHGIIYARTSSEGLFLSKDGGTTWQRAEAMTPDKPSFWQKNRCWIIPTGAAAVVLTAVIISNSQPEPLSGFPGLPPN